VAFLLSNATTNGYQTSTDPPHCPLAGDFFLFDKRAIPRFRKDGILWKKKKDNRTVREHHEKLKVDGVYTVNCTYASSCDPERPYLHRRVYNLLHSESSLVFVHYFESPPKIRSKDIKEEDENTFNDSEGSDLDGKKRKDRKRRDQEVPIREREDEYERERKNRGGGVKMEMYDERGLSDVFSRRGVAQPLPGNTMILQGGGGPPPPMMNPQQQGPPPNLDNVPQQGLGQHGQQQQQQQLVAQGQVGLVGQPQIGGPMVGQPPPPGLGALPQGGGGPVATLTGQMASGPPVHMGGQIPGAGGQGQVGMATGPQVGARNSFNQLISQVLGENESPRGTRNSFTTLLSQVCEAQNEESQRWNPNRWSPQRNSGMGDCFLSPRLMAEPYPRTPSSSSSSARKVSYSEPWGNHNISVNDFAPSWGSEEGGTKMLITVSCLTAFPESEDFRVVFDENEVSSSLVHPGVIKCITPPHTPGFVPFYVTVGSSGVSNVQVFEYRKTDGVPINLSLQTRLLDILGAPLDPNRVFGRASTKGQQRPIDSILQLSLKSLKERCSLEEVRALLLQQDSEGFSCLHYAAILGLHATAKEMINCGAESQVQDKTGRTAMDWAMALNDTAVMEAITMEGEGQLGGFLNRQSSLLSNPNSELDAVLGLSSISTSSRHSDSRPSSVGLSSFSPYEFDVRNSWVFPSELSDSRPPSSSSQSFGRDSKRRRTNSAHSFQENMG